MDEKLQKKQLTIRYNTVNDRMEIILKVNNIGDWGVVMVGEALKSNTTLVSLNVAGDK